MRTRIGLSLLMILFSSVSFADAIQDQRLDIHCKGYINQFSIEINTSVDPKDLNSQVTTLEVGMVLRTWKPSQSFVYEQPQISGKSLSIEGIVGGGQDHYSYSFPDWGNFSYSDTTFVTGVKIDTSLVSGNFSATCSATIKNVLTSQK